MPRVLTVLTPHTAGRYRAAVVRPDSAVLWELRGRSGLINSCYLHQMPDASFVVSIVVGEQEIARQYFATEGDAVSQATLMRLEFVNKGWTETFRPAAT
jgi:hypothetical protein